MTRAGQILGTPGYLAPEQLLGKSVDGRSDIYSFGVLLFELLTRRLPFEESSAMGMALAALTEPLPSPSDIEASVPVEFGTIVSRAMAREPGERYQSAAELPADLRVMAAALNEESTSTRSIAWRVATVRLGLNRLSWRRRLGLAAGVMAVVILLVAVGLFIARWRTGGPESEIAATAGTLASSLAPSQRNLAVLPLTVGDEDVESRIFGRGLAEVLAIRLSQLSPAHGLQVAGATMVSELEEISAEEVGKRLGIGVVLLCGVQRDSGGLRVSVMLVDTAAGHELDSEEVTGTLSDAFGLQDRVVDAVMRMLRVELRPAEAEAMRAYGTSVARAYYLYLQARDYLQWWDGPEDFDSAVSIFRQALELDPNYALAYAGLGDAYWEKYRFTNDPQWPKETEQVCERAVALDEAHPAGHVCLGRAYGETGRREQAIEQFERAIELDPDSDAALRGLAQLYEGAGRFDVAESTYKRAIDATPQHWVGYSRLGTFYLNQARYREAVEAYEKVIELTPNSFQAYANLGAAYGSMENWTGARAALERSLEIKPTVFGYMNLGTVRFFQDERYFAAGQLYEQALQAG